MKKIVFISKSLLIILLITLCYNGVQSLRAMHNQSFYSQRALDQEQDGGNDYYVASSGDDRAAGTSPAIAWRTIARANSHAFMPGDRVLLEGGETFSGELRLDYDDAGTPARPLTISSYGKGRATINAGDENGIYVRNTMGVQIENLNVVGSGRTTNKGSGVAFVNDLVGDIKLSFVRVAHVEVRGFGECGITIDGNRGKSGFRDVRITDALTHDNELAGIYINGEFSISSNAYAHEDVYIGRSVAHGNPGDPARGRHSGSGIVMSDVNRGVIEHSTAYDNGRLCRAQTGGPVGVWVWDANEIIIQHNESFANRTDGPADGGGFDLDGGVTNSVMQYNYSHDNDGAGYLVMQFQHARPLSGNTVRYNISRNDGRKNGYAGIQLFGDVRDTQIHNNTIYLAPPDKSANTVGRSGDIPRAIYFMPSPPKYGKEMSRTTNISVRNNIFQTAGGLPLVDVPTGHNNLLFQGNSYSASDGNFWIKWNEAIFVNLTDWRAATGQERVGDSDVGMIAEPNFRGAIADDLPDNGSLPPAAYRLLDASPLVDAGLDLERLFRLDPGDRDYFGTTLPQRAALDIGAHEVEAKGESAIFIHEKRAMMKRTAERRRDGRDSARTSGG